VSGIFGGGGSPSPQVSYGSPGGTASIYSPQAQPQADQTYQQFLGQLSNQSLASLNNMLNFGGPPAQNYYPIAQNLASQIYSNPYADQTMSAIQGIAPLLSQVGQQQVGYGNTVAAQAPQLTAAANQIYGTAFDPRQELYNQQLGQTRDLANAQNAVSGLAGSPYGAGLADEATQNFMTSWQNQQLGRQLQGIQGLSAGSLGAANLYGQAGNLQNAGLQQQLAGAQLPYQTSVGMANTGLGGIDSVVNLGNNAYQLPQQTLNDLQSYLQLGQAASTIGGNLAGLSNQQQLAGLGGLGSLVGGSGLLGGSGFLGSFGGNYGGAGLGNFAGSGLSAGDLSAVAGDPSLSLAAYNAANAGSGTGILGALGGLFGGLF
jgi:hypothetical protein